MKRASKLFAILTTFLLLAAAVCVFAFADDQASQTKESDYAFMVYNPTTQSYSYHTNGLEIRSKLASVADGAVITLLKDIVITEKFTYAGTNSGGTAENLADIYLDLNGHKLINALSSSATFIEIEDYAHLHVYSSTPGGAVMSTYITSQINAYTLFNLRYSQAE